eukprot:4501800-Prymnesium_polylepis.1
MHGISATVSTHAASSHEVRTKDAPPPVRGTTFVGGITRTTRWRIYTLLACSGRGTSCRAAAAAGHGPGASACPRFLISASPGLVCTAHDSLLSRGPLLQCLR